MTGSKKATSVAPISSLDQAFQTGSLAGLALLLLGTAITADLPMRQAAWQVLQCCCLRASTASSVPQRARGNAKERMSKLVL